MAPVWSIAGFDTRLSLEYRLWSTGAVGGTAGGLSDVVLANTDRFVASIRSMLFITDFSVSSEEAGTAPLLMALLMVLIPSSSSLGGIVEYESRNRTPLNKSVVKKSVRRPII